MLTNDCKNIMLEYLLKRVNIPNIDVSLCQNKDNIDYKLYIIAKDRFHNPVDIYDKAFSAVICYFNVISIDNVINNIINKHNNILMNLLGLEVICSNLNIFERFKEVYDCNELDRYIANRVIAFNKWSKLSDIEKCKSIIQYEIIDIDLNDVTTLNLHCWSESFANDYIMSGKTPTKDEIVSDINDWLNY